MKQLKTVSRATETAESILDTVDVPEHFVDNEPDQMAVDFINNTKNAVSPAKSTDGTVSVDQREYDDVMLDNDHLRNKVEFFRGLLRGVFYRSDDEIAHNVAAACQKLRNIQYPGLVKDYLVRTYPEMFWYNEPDSRYKLALAKGLHEEIKTSCPGLKYYYVEQIVNSGPEADKLLASYIDSY